MSSATSDHILLCPIFEIAGATSREHPYQSILVYD